MQAPMLSAHPVFRPLLRRVARAIGIAIALLTSLPVSALEPKTGPDSAYVHELETALFAYRGQYRRWPTSATELQSFAQQSRLRLDLSVFSNLSLTAVSPQTIHVSYIAVRPAQERGEFALSVAEIAGQTRR
jgi:hypothetical protein